MIQAMDWIYILKIWVFITDYLLHTITLYDWDLLGLEQT